MRKMARGRGRGVWAAETTVGVALERVPWAVPTIPPAAANGGGGAPPPDALMRKRERPPALGMYRMTTCMCMYIQYVARGPYGA